MKKLILLLLFIPLVFSCSSVSKQELNPFYPGDKWVQFGYQLYHYGYSDSKVDWDDLTGEFYYEFTEDNKVISGWFKEEPVDTEEFPVGEDIPIDHEEGQINNTKDTITLHNYIRGKKVGISFYKPIFYSNDTLVLANYNPLCMGSPKDCREGKVIYPKFLGKKEELNSKFSNFVINNYEDWIMDNESTPDTIRGWQKMFLKRLASDL